MSFIGWIIKRDSEENFNICLPFIDGIYIHIPYMEPPWSCPFFGTALSRPLKYTNVFGLVSPPDNPTSLVGFFFSDESFIPLSSATSADSAALQDLVSSSGMFSKSGDLFVFRSHC